MEDKLMKVGDYTAQVVNSANESIAMGGKSLFAIIKESGKQCLEANLRLRLVALNRNIGTKNLMTQEQVDFTAEYLLNQYHWLTLSDVDLVMRRGRAGEYGELYETLTPAKVLGWFRAYDTEKEDAYAERRENERRQHSFEINNAVRDTKDMIDWYNAVKKQADKPKEKPTPTEAENRQRIVSQLANILLSNGKCATMTEAIECTIKQLEL